MNPFDDDDIKFTAQVMLRGLRLGNRMASLPTLYDTLTWMRDRDGEMRAEDAILKDFLQVYALDPARWPKWAKEVWRD